MPTALVMLLRSIGLICSGHRAVALEDLALRQQVAVLKRTVKRPRLRTSDRLFWILLAQMWRGWRGWRTAVVVVRPDTVVRRHRLGRVPTSVDVAARSVWPLLAECRMGRIVRACPASGCVLTRRPQTAVQASS